MTFNFLIVFTSIATGTVGLIGGVVFKVNPPKKINWWYGYRTKRSMENQETWDCAQKTSAQNMMKYSSISFLTSLLGFIIDKQYIVLSFGIVLLNVLLWAFLSIYKTEIKLKSEFDNK